MSDSLISTLRLKPRKDLRLQASTPISAQSREPLAQSNAPDPPALAALPS